MTVNAAIIVSEVPAKEARQLGSQEFIDRLAEDLRQSSDTDLPHAYFVEEVKLQLAGKGRAEPVQDNNPARRYQTSDCFKSWAFQE